MVNGNQVCQSSLQARGLEEADKPVHGIYELDGDTFKLCYAAPGEERPKEFAAKEGSGCTLAVWKRAKK